MALRLRGPGWRRNHAGGHHLLLQPCPHVAIQLPLRGGQDVLVQTAGLVDAPAASCRHCKVNNLVQLGVDARDAAWFVDSAIFHSGGVTLHMSLLRVLYTERLKDVKKLLVSVD